MEVKRSGALTARGADKLRVSRSPVAPQRTALAAGGAKQRKAAQGEASARLTALGRKA